jgi:hypothetical protein
MPEGARVFSRR